MNNIPIFHPKFESLAQARLFCCIWAWELVHRGPYTTKSGVKDTFKLRKCLRGERKGKALSGAGKACVVANPFFPFIKGIKGIKGVKGVQEKSTHKKKTCQFGRSYKIDCTLIMRLQSSSKPRSGARMPR